MSDETSIRKFQAAVWKYYHQRGRHDLPWRQPEADGSFDPYKIMVSELMLQQTQVSRVIPKYHAFLKTFPDVKALAKAELGDVLRVWNGLGYNRRAKFLHQAAGQIVQDYHGEFPGGESELIKLAGIGRATAAAISAYAFNKPAVFVETNIRTAFIHHFFNDQKDISDVVVLNLVERSLNADQPREWYWALMDYGSHLKKSVGNLNRFSKSYSKQSKFEGSLRQVRGRVIRSLGTGSREFDDLRAEIADDRFADVITSLEREGLVRRHGARLSL